MDDILVTVKLPVKRSALGNLASMMNMEPSGLRRHGSWIRIKQSTRDTQCSKSEGKRRFKSIAGVVTSLQQRYKKIKTREPEPRQEKKTNQIVKVYTHPTSTTSDNTDTARDPILYSDYETDVFRYLKVLENNYEIPNQFPQFQAEVTDRTRAILVDWLNQINSHFRFQQETLYLTIALVDRFLQHYNVFSYHLGVLGLTAIFVASKYEETSTPDLKDFAKFLDPRFNGCTGSILQFERVLLRAVKFNLGYPSALQYFRRFSQTSGCDIVTRTMGKFLLELSLQNYELSSRVSLVAAGSLLLSLRLFQGNCRWNCALVLCSGFTESDVQAVLKPLAKFVLGAEKEAQQTVIRKYSCKECFRVASSLYRDPKHMNILKELSQED